MKTSNTMKRLLATLLCLAMLLSITPVFALAIYIPDEADTYYGEEQTVKIDNTLGNARETNFNNGWKFYLGTSGTAQNPGFNDSDWTSVNLPHDFSIFQNYTSSGEAESGFLPGGTGWYRKTFTIPASLEGKTIILNFDGVYSDATVYVNGTQVGEHHYGYTPFAFDITDLVTCDGATENVIAVKAVNDIPTSRWYSGSGIYRDVTIIAVDPVHVTLNGTHVTTPNIAEGEGDVYVETEICNDGNADAYATVRQTVFTSDDVQVATGESSVSVKAGTVSEVTVAAVVEKPELWSIDDPNLYYVRTEILVDGETVDTYDTTFGFRWFTFDSLGFHVNGENVKLNGVCLHHDQGAALGSAAYYDAMYRQLSIMKDMGANAIRTSHNPADEQFIEICSELGLLVIEEAFDGLVDPKNYNSNDFSKYFEEEIGADNALIGADAAMTYSEFAARSMVRRDRNAPAIFAWSFGNEIQEGTNWANSSRYDDIAANFCQWIADEDGTRPATIGDNNRGGSGDIINVLRTITNNGGVVGFNYANSASTLYSLANSYAGSAGCIIASETSSATNSRGQYKNQNNNSNSDGYYHLTSYDTSRVSWGITAHDSIYNTYQYDNIAGEFVWTGFDYLGEPTPWNGTGTGSVSGRGAYPNSSYFGIVDTTGFEKDTYYLYRSQWNKDETTLHLVTAWDSDNMMTDYYGQTPVWVYSNAPVVKLYRDDTLIGTATRVDNVSPAGHTYYTYTTQANDSNACYTYSGSGADGLYSVFNVTYTPGTISAKAFEADGTTEIQLTGNSGKNSVTTPDAVSKLNVTQNKTEIAADGTSLAYITVDVVDANGNLDTTATNNITFTLTGSGKILGVDNGDQATTAKGQQASALTSATSANINAYAGKALVIVQSTTEAGGFTVDVASTGLEGGTAYVNTIADENAPVNEGLESYTMVRDYTVTAGTAPKLLTTASGTMADGSTVNGTIVWEEISENVYGTAGDYTISGTLTFEGVEPIPVKARLHVIADIIALRNISTVTAANTVPTLPNTVNGVLADGTITGEFVVTWDKMDASFFTTVGDVITINGTATIIGDKTLPVTVSVRVAEQVNTESSNVGPQALTVSQDIPQGYWSDNLASVNNGVTKPGDNTNERWTNWNYRTRSAESTLTFVWATAQMLESVNLFYYYDNCCAYPESVEFSYSLNGVDYEEIDVTVVQEESYYLGAQYSYTFDQPINPVAVQIKLTQQNGTSGAHCVGITETEFMTFAGTIEYSSSAFLSAIIVDNAELEGFAEDTFSYEVMGEKIDAVSADNAGITILPPYEGVVRILTISEDGSSEHTYELTLNVELKVGDVTMDGIITNADVIALARYLVNIVQFNERQIELADYNGDGVIKNSDLIGLARSIVRV